MITGTMTPSAITRSQISNSTEDTTLDNYTFAVQIVGIEDAQRVQFALRHDGTLPQLVERGKYYALTIEETDAPVIEDDAVDVLE